MSFVIRRNLITPDECMCQLKAFWYRAGILLKWSNTMNIVCAIGINFNILVTIV
jgi:hypothetical protein